MNFKKSALLLFSILMISASQASIWKQVTPDYIYDKIKCFKDDKIPLNTFSAFQLKLSKLVKICKKAPENISASKTIIELPYPDGTLHKFRIMQSGTMSDELAKKYPNIRSYSGVSIENNAVTAKIDINETGLHALVREANDQMVIDPICNTSTKFYIAYWKSMYKSTRPADMR